MNTDPSRSKLSGAAEADQSSVGTTRTSRSSRTTSTTRKLAITLAIVLCVAAVVYVLGMAGAPSLAAPADVPVPAAVELLPRDVAEATAQDLQQTIPLTGTIQALNQTEIQSQQTGEIREVLVREGESVQRGQVLARQDTTELEAKLRDKLGALAVGQAQLAQASKNLNANASLLQKKFISQNAFDNVQNSYEINEATLGSLRAQVEQARKALAEAVIRSPIDGVIAERIAQPGMAVAVNAKLFAVHDLSLMNVEALVPASDIPRVAVGQTAKLSIEGFGDRAFIGKVDRINPATEPGSRSILVHLLVGNGDGQLKGGMFAQGVLNVSSTVSAIVVPVAAVRQHEGQATVFRIVSGTLVKQAVELGMRDASGDVIEIKSGLAAGAWVVVGDLAGLQSGQAVHVVAAAEAVASAEPRP